jgi:hypothetical protein
MKKHRMVNLKGCLGSIICHCNEQGQLQWRYKAVPSEGSTCSNWKFLHHHKKMFTLL